MDTAVLVVDDDAATRALLQAILEPAGYDCLLAADAQEARRILAERRVDLMLCDVGLPGESGLDLVETLDEDRDVAVVMISGRDDPELAERAFDLGAYGYLVKSFRESEVLINIRSATRRRRRDDEVRERQDRLEQALRDSGAALSRARSQLDDSHDMLRRSREDPIRRLARAAEYRDPETSGHVERMSRYCELLAQGLGLHAPSMLAAGAMHDIGKLAVPDSILLKPGPLTVSEREIMETHTEVGYRILSGPGGGLLDLAARIALSHHERYDGGGYPYGLRGDDIPLEGRIAAVADVFDALTSNRVYRQAFSVDKALDIVRGERGGHFDPRVLDCFLVALPEVAEIQARSALDLEVRELSTAAPLSADAPLTAGT
ncbi:MAG TPA: HD domain-containing phosphohydrolase [Solirubrobacteraceae bacterium]